MMAAAGGRGVVFAFFCGASASNHCLYRRCCGLRAVARQRFSLLPEVAHLTNGNDFT